MKLFKNVIPLFILNNINGTNNIEADKITVIDLMTFKEYKTIQKDLININSKIDGENDLTNIINSKLFKTAEGEILDSAKFNNYEIKMFSQENKYPTKFDNSKNLNIYISPSRFVEKNNIIISFIDNSNYSNNKQIRLTSNDKNYIYLKKKENLTEQDIVILLSTTLIVNDHNNINDKIKTNGDISKFFISSLKIGGTEVKLTNNIITKDQLFEIRNAILTNKKIELSLDLLKKVNLECDTTNLKNNIKTSIEIILNKYNSGHLITVPKYNEIILAINTFTTNKLTDLVEKNTNTSYKNNNNEVDLNKTFTIILDKSCYEDPSKNKFYFAFDFLIADNIKDSTEFADDYFKNSNKSGFKNNDYNTIYNSVINDLKRYNKNIADNDFEILFNNSKIKSTDTFSDNSSFTIVIKNKIEGILKDKVKEDDKNDDKKDNINNNNNQTPNDNDNQNPNDDKTNKKVCSNYKSQ